MLKKKMKESIVAVTGKSNGREGWWIKDDEESEFCEEVGLMRGEKERDCVIHIATDNILRYIIEKIKIFYLKDRKMSIFAINLIALYFFHCKKITMYKNK